MEKKLVVVIMGQDNERFREMCFKSIKDADEIVYCDGGSSSLWFDDEINELSKLIGKNIKVIKNIYNQEDKQMNGKQRNFYLDYVKKNYPDYWCLAIDLDEVVEDLSKIKDFIQNAPKGVYSVHMRHFMYNFGFEDATQNIHFVPNRLFKISEADKYPLVEHTVLQSKNGTYNKTMCTTIWHLAHTNHCFSIKKRYDKNIKHSNIHTKDFLDAWYRMHLFGSYPVTQVNPKDIPEIILNEFEIDKDELYFANRGLETKHFIMAKNWINYYRNKLIPKDIQSKLRFIEFGCGKAPFGYAINSYNEKYTGVEISNYAVENAFVPIFKGNISTFTQNKKYDVILLIDVLEHLNNKELDKALDNIKKFGTNFIFSIPFDADPELNIPADPNLRNDKTHKQFRNKREWIKLIETYGIKIKEAPKDWLYSNQLLIGEKIK